MFFMKNTKKNMGKYSFESVNISNITAKISKHFNLRKEKHEKAVVHYLDTFDWRLYRKNLTLVYDNSSYTLINLRDNKPLLALTIEQKKDPNFWWDFPQSKLKKKLRGLIGTRSLIHVCNIETSTLPYSLLNNDEKTVARIHFKTFINRRDKSLKTNLIFIDPVSSYPREYKRVRKIFCGLGLKEKREDLLKILLSKTSIVPGSYTGKINIELIPDIAAQDAVVKIFSTLLDTMTQNEAGIINDIDTEFLHDFRVAVRRTRSALTQIKGVFPDTATNLFKTEFKQLGTMTNRLRDLDVYLLEKDKYIKFLPSGLQTGIQPLFKKLESERKKEHVKLARFLKSQNYRDIIKGWDNFLKLSSIEQGKGVNSDVPAFDFCRVLIRKKFKKILKEGKEINPDSPDIKLHSLRIECKKLRYLLEFFSSLFPKNEIATSIKHLKVLQDNLGEFNDYYVQQASMKEFLAGLDAKGGHKDDVSISVDALLSLLHQKQNEVRGEFSKTFNEFNSKGNVKLYKKLFAGSA